MISSFYITYIINITYIIRVYDLFIIIFLVVDITLWYYDNINMLIAVVIM